MVWLQGLKNRAPDEKALGEDVGRQRLSIDLAARLGKPYFDHLPGIVPLVHRRCGVQAFVALQADERIVQRGGKHLGDFSLANAGLTLQKQGPLHLEREKDAGREPAVGEIIVSLEQRNDIVDMGWKR